MTSIANVTLGADDIADLIADHAAAHDEFNAACNGIDEVAAQQEGRKITRADRRRYNAAEAAETAAFDAVLKAPVNEVSALRKKAEFVLDYLDSGDIVGDEQVVLFLESLLRLPAMKRTSDDVSLRKLMVEWADAYNACNEAEGEPDFSRMDAVEAQMRATFPVTAVGFAIKLLALTSYGGHAMDGQANCLLDDAKSLLVQAGIEPPATMGSERRIEGRRVLGQAISDADDEIEGLYELALNASRELHFLMTDLEDGLDEKRGRVSHGGTTVSLTFSRDSIDATLWLVARAWNTTKDMIEKIEQRPKAGGAS